MPTDLAEALGILSAFGLGIFALCSEWLSHLDALYYHEKARMEHWGQFSRHGPGGYAEIWSEDDRIWATSQAVNFTESASESRIGSEGIGPVQCIVSWPLSVRSGRVNWSISRLIAAHRIFSGRAKMSDAIYGPMISRALAARRLRWFAETESARRDGEQMDEYLEAQGLVKWFDRSQMNGHWSAMTGLLLRGRFAWIGLVFGATIGTLGAFVALIALLVSH